MVIVIRDKNVKYHEIETDSLQSKLISVMPYESGSPECRKLIEAKESLIKVMQSLDCLTNTERLNRKLKDAEGKIGMTVDPSCIYLIKDLEQCQRDRKGGLDKSQIELTHALDACSYGISHRFPIRRMVGVSRSW